MRAWLTSRVSAASVSRDVAIDLALARGVSITAWAWTLRRSTATAPRSPASRLSCTVTSRSSATYDDHQRPDPADLRQSVSVSAPVSITVNEAAGPMATALFRWRCGWAGGVGWRGKRPAGDQNRAGTCSTVRLNVTARVIRKTRRRVVVLPTERMKVKVRLHRRRAGRQGAMSSARPAERAAVVGAVRSPSACSYATSCGRTRTPTCGSSGHARGSSSTTRSTSERCSRLGAQVQGDILATIAAGVPPPLSSSITVERKGSSKLVIDTGAMRQGVSWELF